MSNDMVTSKGATTFFFVAFIIFTVIHGGLLVWKRSWYMIWFVVGGILEISGYSKQNGSQTVQVIIAPVFLAASIYISYGKLLKGNNVEHISPINIVGQSIFFIAGDILAFGLQVSGIVIGLIKNERIGTALVIVGFVVQLVWFACFVAMNIIAHKRSRRGVKSYDVQKRFQWPTYFKVLYVICTLFFIRIIFRLIEYSQGWGGYIFLHAIFSYIFDGATTLLMMVVLGIFHPAFFVPKKLKKDEENSYIPDN